MAGSHVDPVDQQRPQFLHDPRGVIAPSCRRTGVEQDQVGLRGGLAHRFGQRGGVIGDDGKAQSLPTPRLHLRA